MEIARLLSGADVRPLEKLNCDGRFRDSNQIGDAGATALAEALKVNTTLQTVDLGKNKIGAAGKAALKAAIKVNTKVKVTFWAS